MKRSFRRILCLFLMVLTLLLFSLTAWAEDYSAVLNSLHFDIALQTDGSALITETREVVFSGDHLFSRYGVNNTFTGPRVFNDWEVSIDGTPASQLDEPDNENRPESTFVVEDNDGGNTVSIYFRQQGSGTRVFRISYRMENAVKLYADVGEFYWNLTGETGISDIGTLTATLTVPEGVPTENFLIWAHGPQNGTFDKQPDGSAALRVENVPLGTIVDIRSTLPAYYFTGGWEQEGEALPGIFAKEQELADSANAKREEELRRQEEEARRQAERDAYWAAYWEERNAWEAEHPVLNSIQNSSTSLYSNVVVPLSEYAPIVGVALFALIAFIGRLRRNPNKFRLTPTQSPQYYRDLPDDRPAPAVDRLVHFYDGKSDVSRQISATLLELNLKGLVHFQRIDKDVELVLNAQLGEKLFPSPVPQETGGQSTNQDHIPGYQEILWGFLLNAADGSAQLAMKNLKQYIQNNQEAAWHFRSSFESAVSREYKERVKTQVVKRSFFGKSKLPLLLPVIAGILAMLTFLFSTLYDGIIFEASLSAGIDTFVKVAIMLLLYYLGKWFAQGRCEILDQQSEDDLALWQAFGRFLDDFTTFEEKELPEFSVWREYMVYAVAMGNGQKVAKALCLKYPDALSTGTDSFNDDMYRWLQDMALYDAMDSIGREVAEARLPGSSSSSSDSDTNWSDGSGGGGGFSDSDGGSDSGSGGDFID